MKDGEHEIEIKKVIKKKYYILYNFYYQIKNKGKISSRKAWSRFKQRKTIQK